SCPSPLAAGDGTIQVSPDCPQGQHQGHQGGYAEPPRPVKVLPGVPAGPWTGGPHIRQWAANKSCPRRGGRAPGQPACITGAVDAGVTLAVDNQVPPSWTRVSPFPEGTRRAGP